MLSSQLHRRYKSRRLDSKDRACELVENSLGGIANDESRNTRARHRPHNHKIRLQRYRQFWYCFSGRSPEQMEVREKVFVGIRADPVTQRLAQLV